MKSNIYFKRDLYAVENDRQLRAVCKAYPVWGEAVFFSAICMMYRVDGEKYNVKDLADDVADALYTDNTDYVEEIVQTCIQKGLFKSERNLVWSDRVRNTCAEQRKFKKKQAEYGKLGGIKKAENMSLSNKDISRLPQGYPKATPRSPLANNKDQDQDQNNNNKYIVSSDEDTRPNGNEETDSDSPLFAEKAKDETPYSEIVQYWNERAVKNGLSQCMKITDERKRHICNRWREYHEDVYKAIDKIMASDFCKEGNWCGFDWVLKPSNMVKVLEGKYDNKKGYGANTGKKFSPTDLSGQYSGYKAKKVQI